MQAALSAKDLRRVLRSGDVESLSLPALDYLRHNDGPAMDASLLTVTSSSSVFEMFERFVSSGSHRLFVADEGGKLVGVLSLKDALALVIGSVSRMERTVESYARPRCTRLLLYGITLNPRF